MSTNPLQQFFRHEKIFISLPSGTSYYTDDTITFTDSGELGILPMTAKDEVSAKNPDALLNGEAISGIIKSCVPSITNPKKLLTNDIDTLLIAIRHATYGDDIEVSLSCPECEQQNTFNINITQSLANAGKLDKEYSLELETGIKIIVRPFVFTDTVTALKTQFKQMQIAQDVADPNKTDEQRMALVSGTFKEIAELNSELLTNCIVKIEIPGSETPVTDHAHIKEFLNNIERSTFSSLDNLVNEINEIGVNKKFNAVCEHCEHKWEAIIDFNPVNFFTES